MPLKFWFISNLPHQMTEYALEFFAWLSVWKFRVLFCASTNTAFSWPVGADPLKRSSQFAGEGYWIVYMVICLAYQPVLRVLRESVWGAGRGS